MGCDGDTVADEPPLTADEIPLYVSVLPASAVALLSAALLPPVAALPALLMVLGAALMPPSESVAGGSETPGRCSRAWTSARSALAMVLAAAAVVVASLGLGVPQQLGLLRPLDRVPFLHGMVPSIAEGNGAAGFSLAEMPDLRGRVAVVTGANSGLGYWYIRTYGQKEPCCEFLK